MNSAIYECKFLSVRPITISGFRFRALWLVEVKTKKITLAERYWKRVEVEQYFWCSNLRQSAETKFSTKHCTDIQDIQTFKSWQSRTLRTNSSFEGRGLPPAEPKTMFKLHRTRHQIGSHQSLYSLYSRENEPFSLALLNSVYSAVDYLTVYVIQSLLVCFNGWHHWTLVCLSPRGVWVSCQNSRLLLQLAAPLSTYSTGKVLLKQFFSLKKWKAFPKWSGIISFVSLSIKKTVESRRNNSGKG